MKLIMVSQILALAFMVVAPVGARILATCAETPGYYFDKALQKCIKACDASNNVVLFGHKFSCSIKSLTTEMLKYSNSRAIPQSIVGLTQLTTLELHSGIKRTIPSELGKLTTITHLDLNWNDIFIDHS